MKRLCILLVITLVFGFGSIAEAKKGTAEMVKTDGEIFPYIFTNYGVIVQIRDTDELTGDLEGTMDSFCSLIYPYSTDPKFSETSCSCLSIFSGTLKGEPITAAFTIWLPSLESEVRKFEIMQGTGGLVGEGTYTGPRGGVRVLEFNYWFCDRENAQACEARMGY